MIELNHVTKEYPNGAGIHDISLTIPDHGVYGLLGVNGAGKSTLMNVITGYTGYTVTEDSCSTKDKAPNGAICLVPLQPKKI